MGLEYEADREIKGKKKKRSAAVGLGTRPVLP